MSKLLQRLLQAFERKSVDTVLRAFTVAATDLRKLADKLDAEAQAHQRIAAAADANASLAADEAGRAKSIAQRIEALITG